MFLSRTLLNRKFLGLACDFAPFEVLGSGVDGEGFFVLNQNGTDDAGIISATEIQDGVGDDADFFVGVQEREGGLGDGVEWQFFVNTFHAVFYGVGQKIQLASQMREKRLINLREFQFPLRKRANDFVGDGGRDRCRAAVQKISNLCHESTLGRNLPGTQKHSSGAKPGCGRQEMRQNETLTLKSLFGFIIGPIDGDEFTYVRCN